MKTYYSNDTTSKAAAKAAKKKAPSDASRILQALKRKQMTCWELEQELEIPHQTCSARIRGLRERSLIADSGRTRKTAFGRPAIVWKVC